MTISVALCTYNGERYLPAQLESLVAQSLLPDELVVCDDASSDGTMTLLESFAAVAPFAVRVIRNEQNLRSTANFAKAISLCTGELIALCDQDDVWYPHKLATLSQRMRNKPDLGFIFSDANLVDAELKALNGTAWQSIQLSPRKQQLIASGNAHRVFLSQYVATGATMMIRSGFRSFFLPIPAEWVHDAWIAFLLAAISPIDFVTDPMLDYRQHSDQQIGLPKPRRGLWAMYQTARRMQKVSFADIRLQFAQAYERLHGRPDCNPRFLKGLEQKLEHLAQRHELRRRRLGRLMPIAQEALRGNYSRYSYGWKSVVQDLFF